MTKGPARGTPDAPEADQDWHPIAREWFTSLGESGQSQFYEPSDWATARVWAHLLSAQLMSGRASAQMITAWSGGATELLTTEGARRRARVELEQQEEEDPAAAAKVTRMASYRKAAESS